MAGIAESREFKTTCPFCLAEVDVHFDIKGRPYWRCWHCEVRTFATRAALQALKADGWIWSGKRPPGMLEGWLGRVTARARSANERGS